MDGFRLGGKKFDKYRKRKRGYLKKTEEELPKSQ